MQRRCSSAFKKFRTGKRRAGIVFVCWILYYSLQS